MNSDRVLRIVALVAFPAMVLYAFLTRASLGEDLKWLLGVRQFTYIFDSKWNGYLAAKEKFGEAADIVLHYAVLVAFVFALIPGKKATAPVLSPPTLPTPAGILD